MVAVGVRDVAVTVGDSSAPAAMVEAPSLALRSNSETSVTPSAGGFTSAWVKRPAGAGCPRKMGGSRRLAITGDPEPRVAARETSAWQEPDAGGRYQAHL